MLCAKIQEQFEMSYICYAQSVDSADFVAQSLDLRFTPAIRV